MKPVLMMLILVGCGVTTEIASTDQAVALPDVEAVDAAGPGRLIVRWVPDPDAIDYCVLQSSPGLATFTTVACMAQPALVSYIASGLVADTQYCFAVQSVHGDGTVTPPGLPGCGTAPGPAPGPGGLTVSSVDVGQQLLGWNADPAAFKYLVQQSANGGDPVFIASLTDPDDPFGNPPPTSYTAIGLSAGTDYCYSIVAAFSDGTLSNPGTSDCAVAQ